MDLDALIREAGGLRRLAVELVGESAADDVVQDALIAGVRSAPADDGSIRPWLARVVRNLAAGRHRTRARREARDRDAARPERLPSASDLVERMDVQRVVAEEVLALVEPYRSAILAVHFEGVSAEEYARSRGVPGATVRSWTKRGLDTLRTRLDRRFGGDRRAWTACLLPFARSEAAAIPLAIGGGLLLQKLLASAVVVVLALVVLWATLGTGSRDDHEIQLAASALELATPTEDSALERAPAVAETTSRVEAIVAPESLGPPQLTGRVVWTPDREPAVGIGVWLSHDERPDLGLPRLVVTDAAGRFRVDGLGDGEVTVSLDRLSSPKPVQIASGLTRQVEFELPRGTRITGRVLDARGSPVVGAEVCVAGWGNGWSHCVTRSAADGSYEIEGMGNGARVFARSHGHGPSGSYALQAGFMQVLDAVTTRDLWLTGATGVVEGHIVDAAGNARPGIAIAARIQDEQLVDGAGVETSALVAEYVKSDALGDFSLSGLRPGRYALEVHSLHRTTSTSSVEVRANRTTRADIVLPLTAQLFGQVTDVAGQPCGGAHVQATSLDGPRTSSWILTNAEGRYGTGFMPAGRVVLQVRHGRGRLELQTELAPGEAREWSPVLGAMISIRGRVVDLAGRPLPGITVTTGNQQHKREVLSDASGAFELEMKVGSRQSVSAWQGQTLCAQRDVSAGDTDVELVYELPSSRIVGRIVDANGDPPRDMVVNCGRLLSKFDESGHFESPLLRSGSHSIRVHPYGVGWCHLLDVEVAPGETKVLGDLVLPGRGDLVVALHPDADVDVQRVRLLAYRSGSFEQVVVSSGLRSGEDWTAAGLPEGEYRVYADGGGAAVSEKRVTIRAGESTLVDLDLHFGMPVRVKLDGKRLGACELEVRDESGGLVAKREFAMGQGFERLLRMRPGRYELVVASLDGRTGNARVEVDSEDTAEKILKIVVE